MKNKVSVIIPIYNVEQYLARCLDSVINQTYKNLEIICVNDCSPDNSINILEEYSQKDNRIKIIQREKNGGLSAARNSGFDIAVGEYVYFLDSDDWIDLDYIEKMVAIASKYDSDIVLNTNIVYEYSDKPSKEFVWYTYHEKSPDGVVLSREMAVNFTHCMTWCHLYKRDFILNHHFTFPEGYKHEDNYYNHVTKISTDKIIAFYGACYHYLQRENSIMSDTSGHTLAYLKITKLICDFHSTHTQYNHYKVLIAKINTFFPIESAENFELIKYCCSSILKNFDNLECIYGKFEMFCINTLAYIKDFATYQKLYPKGMKAAFILQTAKKQKTKISVIIPIYNKEKFLAKCIESVINQTLKDIEIICLNDCSTDNSLTILEKYSKIDDRIKIVNFEKNQGASYARNKGIDIANGEYLSFIDADDYIDTTFLEKLYNSSNIADIVKGTILLDDNNSFANPNWQTDGKEFLQNPASFIYGFTSALYKTIFIKQNDIRFPLNVKQLEDPYFLIWAVAKSQRYAACDNAYYYYKISDKKNENIDDVIDGSSKIIALINELEISKSHYLIIFERIYNINLSLYNSDVTNVNNKKQLNAFLQKLKDICLYKKDFMQNTIKRIRNNSNFIRR